MKLFLASVVALLLLKPLCGQWISTGYNLKGGWNAIYLHGDSSHTTLEDLFSSDPEVVEVWRWNPNPDQVQFTSSPLVPSQGTPEWSVWERGGENNTLFRMIGQTAYLVRCSGVHSENHTVTIPQRVLPPSAEWVRNGANLMGFPSKLSTTTYPTMGSYFATFPAAIAANVRIYKYVGGELGPGNPLQVFSPNLERLDRNQAYWFDSEVVGNFYAPIEISLSKSSGLDFGRNGSTVTARLLNRSSNVSTITVAPVASANAPTGQDPITGSVPLLSRSYNAQTGSWTETDVTGPYQVVVGPNSAVELTFGIKRSAMEGASNAFYASMLRLSDSAGLYDILLPVTARKDSTAGLWVGEANVGGVESKVPGSADTATPEAYPLRYLIHVDDTGAAHVLSQVFVGKLAGESPQDGVTPLESRLSPAEKAGASRIVAAHMPLDRVLAANGTFGIGGSVSCTIDIPFNDPVNPFVHQYHPDHDNKSGSAVLESGQESYDISRSVTFTFAPTPPAGVSPIGYGGSVMGGTYREVIHGIHKESVTVSGNFTLRRVSEIGTLTR